MNSGYGGRYDSRVGGSDSSKSSDSSDSIDSTDDEADLIRHRRHQEKERRQKREWEEKRGREVGDDEEEDARHQSKKRHQEGGDPTADQTAELSTGEPDIVIHDSQWAFCCSHCTCTDYVIARFFHTKMSCETSGNSNVWHRGCCHRIQEKDADTLTPMMQAIHKGVAAGHSKKGAQKAKTLSHLWSKYKSAVSLEKRFYNSQFDTAKDSQLYANEAYIEFAKEFRTRVKEEPKLQALRVLDLFSGIGSGALVLKKMGFRLSKVVSVEHDPVATHVNKFHHGGVELVHFDKYEEIRDDEALKALIVEHGPFDLLLAGAPCTNYSKVNGYRKKNSKKEEVNYLLDVGRLIKKIDEIQKDSCPEQSSLLFLSENVNFEQWRIDEVSKSYGVPPVRLDAKDFGPCKRDRLYWTNIPLEKAEKYTDVASEESACKLLDHGFLMTETVVREEEGDTNVMIPKANTFMASKVRIDDDRMIKVREVGDKWVIDKYSVSERERMSGLPVGYVRMALKDLFSELRNNAFLNPEQIEGKIWADFLREDLHHFRFCKFEMIPKGGESPYFDFKISAPTEGKVVSFYSEEDYAKHLIGNGWSLPVIEYILSGLENICTKVTHERFQYDYPWKPYNLGKEKDNANDEIDL